MVPLKQHGGWIVAVKLGKTQRTWLEPSLNDVTLYTADTCDSRVIDLKMRLSKGRGGRQQKTQYDLAILVGERQHMSIWPWLWQQLLCKLQCALYKHSLSVPPLGPDAALELLCLDAPSSLLGTHSQNCYPEQWTMEEKCASRFISTEQSSGMHFIRHLRKFHQIENAFMYLFSIPTTLSCPSLLLLEIFPKLTAFMQASVSCSGLWGYLDYRSIQNPCPPTALSTDVLLIAEQNILGAE